MQSSRVEDNLDPRLASELANWAANEKMSHGVDRINVVVDRERFVQTRNAVRELILSFLDHIRRPQTTRPPRDAPARQPTA